MLWCRRSLNLWHCRLILLALLPQGDLIPWTVGQQFQDADFPRLSGARIVRIAVHPSVTRAGCAPWICHLSHSIMCNGPRLQEHAWLSAGHFAMSAEKRVCGHTGTALGVCPT